MRSAVLLVSQTHFFAAGRGRLGSVVLPNDHGLVRIERLVAAAPVGNRVGVDHIAARITGDGKLVSLFFAQRQVIADEVRACRTGGAVDPCFRRGDK